jgi:hypothetical protein
MFAPLHNTYKGNVLNGIEYFYSSKLLSRIIQNKYMKCNIAR